MSVSKETLRRRLLEVDFRLRVELPDLFDAVVLVAFLPLAALEEEASIAFFFEDNDRGDGIEHDCTNLWSDSVSQSFSKDEVVMVDTGDCGWLSSITTDIMFGCRLRCCCAVEIKKNVGEYYEPPSREFVKRSPLFLRRQNQTNKTQTKEPPIT